MDEKDKLILTLLQKDGRMTASEMAEKVDLSVPAVTERIRKLTEGGVLKDFRAVLDAKKVGYDVTAYILLDMSSSSSYGDMVQYAQDNDEVLECHSITGEGSHILKVRAHDTSSLESLLRDIQSWPGVIRTHTMIVMSTFKEATCLKL
ncbi:MAG TPA: Lrp/AsnC family transcriptional regulator [Candidatus Marinimicrobia bacterium]|jgi:Lrp/AsnC family leucine-responsive transcriptional regulator|nr:Lrp/AsnC family transcriptional regulator [Candidatus Neomarinimicrobiota bacterium]MDP7121796.1 Lrp/AsnC family transcriptional regulator [Candidatus Neomarinimicrobiota bacterium]MDP7483249.1 Lrp/AsnC family transcriptional regulator [Candidatus Neomarinimicrobiota bacterium]MDP7528333.1 Lrp/AsnC family transcriptional regulator [Candidatus Neomarinimicrobiota bacterium]MDP7716435.1 Lrp/AsnC family transcriptional regulator [Candidatus Neomarinimicrobiota bacterium]|tara:strand:+ start:5670 stop:6113 length:444 start_codon:yes stop_codon:yes gene_type:complete